MPISIRARVGNGYGLVVVLVAASLALIIGLIAGAVTGYGLATDFFDSRAEREAIAAMYKSITLAKPDVTAALQGQAAKSKNPALMLATRKVYVANADVVLGPVDEPMTILLPEGKQWASGELGKITLLRVRSLDVKQVTAGFPFFDYMCHGELIGMTPVGSCDNPQTRTAGSAEEMARHMRLPTNQELSKWLGKNAKGAKVSNYRVATSNFVAAPDYTPHIIAILMPEGLKMLGGQLGFTDVVQLDNNGTARPTFNLYDNLCQHNGQDLTSEGGKVANIAHPATFAPAAIIKRVSECRQP